MSDEAWKPNGEKCPLTNIKEGNGVMVHYSEDGTQMHRMTYKDRKSQRLTLLLFKPDNLLVEPLVIRFKASYVSIR